MTATNGHNTQNIYGGNHQHYPTAAEMFRDVDVPPLRWLWPNWIPREMITMLVARPDAEKSYLALDLAHRLIEGTGWPDGTPIAASKPVLYVSGAGTPPAVRLQLAGWKKSALQHLSMMRAGEGPTFIDLDNAIDRNRLEDTCNQIKPGLIIVDSYNSTTRHKKNDREGAVRFLGYLAQTAQEYDCGVLLVHCLYKARGAIGLNHICGSLHVTARMPSVIAMQQTDENNTRRLGVLKSNISHYPPFLRVSFEPHPANGQIPLLRYELNEEV